MQRNHPDSSKLKGVYFRIFRRSFFIETLWNNAKLQNIGFVFCIMPVLDVLYPDPEEKRKAIVRHLEKVNTTPPLCAVLVGIMTREEQDKGGEAASRNRRTIMTSLAAQGDSFFWSRLKPLSAVIGVLTALWLGGALPAAMALLIMYNMAQAPVRLAGFYFGLREGALIVKNFKRPEWEMILWGMRFVLGLALGLVVGLLALQAAQITIPGGGAHAGGIGMASVVLIPVVWILINRNWSYAVLVYLASCTAIALYMLLDSGIIFI
jgi:mannose/fructose/N-acetylgalactosamine-specific phosphotransferase system component IID